MLEPLDHGAGAAVAFFLLCMALMEFSRPGVSAVRVEDAPEDRSRGDR